MQRVQALAIYASIVSLLVIGTTYALLTIQTTIPGSGTVKSVGIGVYWDLECTNTTSSLDWGLLEPGSEGDFTLYLKNEGNSALTLNMTSENWSPSHAGGYITVTWNREGQQISPDEVMEAVITLAVSEDVQNVKSFSFDLIISGTG